MTPDRLEELVHRLRTEDTSHIRFLDYDAKTAKSSMLGYSPSNEYFRKSKRRSTDKAVWEYLMLRVWRDLLEAHSEQGGPLLSAPTPYDVQDEALIMKYLPATNATHLNRLTKDTRAGALHTDLRVDASLIHHVGALCAVKDRENLVHRDFQPRHLLFAYTLPIIYVIDVENSYEGPREEVAAENARLCNILRAKTHGRLGKGRHGQPYTFDELFDAGRNTIRKERLLPEIVQRIEDRYGIHLDPKNYSVRLRG